MVPSQKPITLTMDEKLQLIRAYEQENVSVRELQSRFNCESTQIYEILRRREDLRQTSLNSNRKRYNLEYQYKEPSSMHELYYTQDHLHVKQETLSENSIDCQSHSSTTSYQPEYDYIESGYYEREIRNYREALDHIKALQEFALRVNNHELFTGTCQLRSIAEKKLFRQTSLLDYWVPLNNN